MRAELTRAEVMAALPPTLSNPLSWSPMRAAQSCKIILTVVLSAVALVGCEDEDTATRIGAKPDVTAGTDATVPGDTALTDAATDDSTAGNDASDSADPADLAGGPDTGQTDAGQTDAGQTDAVSGSDVASCEGPDGCWSCDPTTSLQILNQCNDLVSVPFDNKARLPLLNADGTLPALP